MFKGKKIIQIYLYYQHKLICHCIVLPIILVVDFEWETSHDIELTIHFLCHLKRHPHSCTILDFQRISAIKLLTNSYEPKLALQILYLMQRIINKPSLIP